MIIKIIFIFLILNWNSDLIQTKEGPLKFVLSDIQQGKPIPFIINGTEAEWHGTRYQISLRLKIKEKRIFGRGHICGGSLISENIVLSAAHCLWNYGQLKLRKAHEFSVVMGNLNRYQRDNALTFNVTRFSVLPTFNVSFFIDDICILFLSGKVPHDFLWANIIELNEDKNVAEGTPCTASGWGRTETGKYPDTLRIVDIPIVGESQCRTNYGDVLRKGMICAGYMEGQYDSCQADSGGPLNCNNKLVGIVSFGAECGRAGFPGVYANVANYIKWIRSEIGTSGVSTLTSIEFLRNILIIFTFCKKYFF